uniref:Uncharacterized protein n=1 Tax=Microviridae sp. ctX0F7 TaxID=2824999 RepID=A0A8S5NYW2_9VIRU|nr:MAG TPA: hypothetical protein [Microviridae sp. ctX0F7]
MPLGSDSFLSLRRSFYWYSSAIRIELRRGRRR